MEPKEPTGGGPGTDSPNALRTWLAATVKAVALAWLICHAALTAIYVSPSNPIRLETEGYVVPVMSPLFSQNWSFFAPDPLDSDEALLTRCLTSSEAAAARNGSVPTEGWYDLSTPFWERFQRNRLTAYDRLIRPQSAALRNLLGYPIEMESWVKACNASSKEACKRLEDEMKPLQERSKLLLTQVASGFCKDIATDLESFTDAAIRVRITPPVPWSQRRTGKPTPKDLDIGIFSLKRTAAQTHLYRVRAAA
jgi:hypothetical protein